MSIATNFTDENWLKNGVITALTSTHGYQPHNAEQIFNESGLLDMLKENAEYVFHYDTEYWANRLAETKTEVEKIILSKNSVAM